LIQDVDGCQLLKIRKQLKKIWTSGWRLLDNPKIVVESTAH
jgi:hypothetical protein